jgi:predicted Zn-dependent protease
MEGREPGRLETLLMTHPPTSERIGKVKAETATLASLSKGSFPERYLSKTSSIRK